MNGGIEAILSELIELVQATAPALWAMARRQVMANTVGNAMWGGLFLLVAIALGLAARYSARRWENMTRTEQNAYADWTWQNGAWLAGCAAVIALAGSLVFLHSLIMYSINPDYYAIKVLLELVR